jgi:hypothetical protein
MIHKWKKQTDGSGSMVLVVLFYYKKAFDLIDHGILEESFLPSKYQSESLSGSSIFSKTVSSGSS